MKTKNITGKWSARILSTLLTLCVSLSAARAQWKEGIASGGAYDNPANWVSGSVNHQFVTSSGAYGWTTDYNVTTPAGPVTISGDFVYRNQDNVNVNFNPVGNSTWSFTAPVTTFTVELGATVDGRSLTIGSSGNVPAFDFQNHDAVFNIDPAMPNISSLNRDWVTLWATISNLPNLAKTGGGSLVLASAASVDRVVIDSGKIRIGGSGVLTANSINVVNRGSGIESTVSTNNPTVIAGAVNLYSGAVSMPNQAMSIGTLRLQSGRSVVGSNYTGATTLTLGSFERNNFATVSFSGIESNGGIGYASNLVKISGNDDSIRASLVGGSGADGSTTISILPWAVGAFAIASAQLETRDTKVWGGVDLVTYTTAGGFRSLTAAEYYTGPLAGAGAQDNVRLATASTVSADLTVNAIRMNANLAIDAGKTLTVTSGAIIFPGDNGITGAGGILNTGDHPLILSGYSNNTLSVNLTNSVTDPNLPGLISANVGSGNTFTGNNSYGGMTLVQGNARFNSVGALPHTTELRIDRSGNAAINAASGVRKLSGVGTLTVGTGGLWLGQLDEPLGNRMLSVNNGGILAPGDLSGDYQAGTLLVDATAVEFNAGSIFSVDLTAGANDLLQNLASNSTLTLNGGAVVLSFLDGYTPAAGDQWQLTAGFTSASGDFDLFTVSDSDPLHADWKYNLSLLDNKNLVLTLDSIPEPSVLALCLGGAALLLTLALTRKKSPIPNQHQRPDFTP